MEVLSKSPIALTIGNFDGVHLGHRSLIQQTRKAGQALGCQTWVLTFHPHPNLVLSPEMGDQRLFDAKDQLEQLKNAGVDHVFTQDFNKEFSQVGPAEFCEMFLSQKIRPRILCVGYDFSFGRNRQGRHETLLKECQKRGIELQVAAPALRDERPISSSWVREELLKGNVEKAQSLLGRPYELRGSVMKGHQRGRLLGYPTANLNPSVEFVPKWGVYVSRTRVGSQAYRSVTNVGLNPTFVADQKAKIETYILDQDLNLYGQDIAVEFLGRLRDEKKFSSVDDLKEAIAQDVLRAKEWVS